MNGLHTHLAAWIGKTAYIIPMTTPSGGLLGNNGDRLMHWVFDQILDHFDITRTSDTTAADVVFVPPNGALLEVYSFPELLRQRLIGLHHLPLVLFPSSAYFPTQSPARLFSGRTAPTLWLFRESFSLAHVSSQWGDELAQTGVRLELDHDVVASGHQFVPNLFKDVESRSTGTLVVARVDLEARSLSDGAGSNHSNTVSGGLRFVADRVPYGRIKTALTRRVRRKHLTEAGHRIIQAIPGQSLEKLSHPLTFVDASADQYATFAEYQRFIATHGVVITNRLHVALPAAILGKQVILVEAGYHKLEGVYLQSLRGLNNVRFVKP